MKIVVGARCLNEEKNIPRFLKGYSFADHIVIVDGGSTDNSLELLRADPKVTIFHFLEKETLGGHIWNPENRHLNSVFYMTKEFNPDWLIFDDMDCVPNYLLKHNARYLLKDVADQPQVNVFRLYMWGDDQFFPEMNNGFDKKFTSLWAWKPDEVDIYADDEEFSAIRGVIDEPYIVDTPICLLHKSWHPNTIDEKLKRYNESGLEMQHPLDFAGKPEALPDWAREE